MKGISGRNLFAANSEFGECWNSSVHQFWNGQFYASDFPKAGRYIHRRSKKVSAQPGWISNRKPFARFWIKIMLFRLQNG